MIVGMFILSAIVHYYIQSIYYYYRVTYTVIIQQLIDSRSDLRCG